MRVTKSQIVHGLTEFVQSSILPKFDGDKAVQIIATVAINAAMANNKLVDAVFDNGIIRALLEDDGSGTFEINGVVDAMKAAIQQHGFFPVSIPAVPFLSPRGLTLNLDADDMEAIRRHIGAAL